MPSARSDYLPIADYALIGDCHTAALVARDGSIDWYCPERFDSEAVFSRILDRYRGGYWSIAPEGEYHSDRRYLPNTNILESTHHTSQSSVRVLDLMPIHGESNETWEPHATGESRIVRRIQGVEGTTKVCIAFKPAGNYGLDTARVEPVEGGGLVADCGVVFLALVGADLTFDRGTDTVWRAWIDVREGQSLMLSLVSCRDRASIVKATHGIPCDGGFEQTHAFWKEWTQTCTYAGPYRDEVVRSALVLKLLTYAPTGAVVAAPTTSLPEEIGGPRNWDYRFTWLRDSSLILYALLTIGYDDEAVHFISWLKHVVGRHRPENPQIMYTIDGNGDIPERELTALSGYRDSHPVRIGNAASKQVQLDIYGEVLSAAYIHYHQPDVDEKPSSKVQGHRPEAEIWNLLTHLVDDAARSWKQPDNGIWEVRGGPRDYVYSKLMCWVALDRGIRIAEQHGLNADLDTWNRTRDEIRNAIEQHGYNDTLGTFVQSFGSTAIDSSVLAIPRLGFLPPTDPRVQSTIDVVLKTLTQNGLVYRYKAEDGLPGGEGSFLLCTFWLVEALALSGRMDEARTLYGHATRYKNDVGLFSEEIDPSSGAFLGNFPQGFTHLSLIRAAVNLAKTHAHGPEGHAQNEGQRVHAARQAASKPH